MFRSWHASWLEARAEEVKEAIDVLVEDKVANKRVRLQNSDGSRGPHLPLIIGHHRQSAKTPILSHWHAANQTRVDKFLALSIVQNIIGWGTSVVTDVFPGVVGRFLKDAAWHKERYEIEPLFSLFWNFCINTWFVNGGQKHIHCYAHADRKNQISVCVLVIYLLPGFENFNHTQRTWLVLWEAFIIVELPPWTMAAYPSALFYHFNIDVQGQS
ncbi:hypothetical protein K438DRAFT_1994399 [Mycena galopus ATCC 62051]|nr:hypothetical protein K438DRAFT_1994399 [Mycena galopus ATCC 62051]